MINDVKDPDGRIKKGMFVRWCWSDTPVMQVLRLYAPMGLYHRLVTDRDLQDPITRRQGYQTMPCESDHPAATYKPEHMRVCLRDVNSGDETHAWAGHLVEVGKTGGEDLC